MGRLLGRIFVAFTTALIFFISYTPQLFIIWPWYGREFSIELFTLLVPFKYDPYKPIYAVPQHSRAFPSILVGILLYNYYLCVVTDPGVVPHNWVRNALPQRAFFTYAGSFRNQNSMTLMAMRSRSCLVPQGIVACARNTNHRAHITARRAKGMRPRFAILLSEYWFPPPVDACFAWVSIHTIDS
jgi:hypothetical protein